MAREEQQPMSDARLREIHRGVEVGQMDMDEDEAFFAIRDLLADNERLRAREAAWVAYIERMATFSPAARIEDIQRKIIEARALLASDSGDEAK